jgi:DHA1 family tetracycline resistance protein-like MFS transporter
MLKSRPLLAIFLIVFVDILAFTLVLPYLPFYAETFGASPTQVGLILTSFSFCQFLAGPVLGRMSDRMGRKPVLVLSQIGTCLGFVILALSKNLWMVYLARVLDGVTAGNITVAQAAISDITKPEERAKAFSLIGVSFGLGFFVGPAIAALLSHFSPESPAWGAAILSAASVVCTLTLFQDDEDAHRNKQPFRITRRDLVEAFNFEPIFRYLRHLKLKPLMMQTFFFNLSFSAHISCFALFAERRLVWEGHAFGAKEVGYLYAYLGFLGIAVRSWLIGALIRALGERGTSRLGFVLQTAGFASYALVDSVKGALLASTCASIGSGLIRPTLGALLSHASPPREQGAVFGVGQSLASIASIVAPLVAGLTIQHASLEAWAIFAGGCMIFAFFFDASDTGRTGSAT